MSFLKNEVLIRFFTCRVTHRGNKKKTIDRDDQDVRFVSCTDKPPEMN